MSLISAANKILRKHGQVMQAIPPDANQLAEIARQAGTPATRTFIQMLSNGTPVPMEIATQSKGELNKLHQFVMGRTDKDETTNQVTWDAFVQFLRAGLQHVANSHSVLMKAANNIREHIAGK